MDISVFGLGYVGAVTTACLARGGHRVTGVDVKPGKNTAINEGRSPFFEKNLEELIREGVDAGRIHATADVGEAVRSTAVSFICVGTPSNPDGSLDFRYVRRVCEEIGNALLEKDGYHVIVIRSTLLPGVTEGELIPRLRESSGKEWPGDFGVSVNPEFMREGQAVHDFFNPDRVVIGSGDPRSAGVVEEVYAPLQLKAAMVKTDIPTAEMLKYVDNTFHAMKITFANEIGTLCKRMGIDSHRVMEIFLMDRKLNLSPYYFRPGFAFGGSCLPKDVRALIDRTREMRVACPLIESIIPSNNEHINRVVELIMSQNRKRVGIIGLTFKSQTSDIRESPAVTVIDRLFEAGYRRTFDKGFTVRVYDPNTDQFDLENLPGHIIPLLDPSLEHVVQTSDVLVVTHGDSSFRGIPALMREDQVLIDLVRVIDPAAVRKGTYIGLCW